MWLYIRKCVIESCIKDFYDDGYNFEVRELTLATMCLDIDSWFEDRRRISFNAHVMLSISVNSPIVHSVM